MALKDTVTDLPKELILSEGVQLLEICCDDQVSNMWVGKLQGQLLIGIALYGSITTYDGWYILEGVAPKSKINHCPYCGKGFI